MLPPMLFLGLVSLLSGEPSCRTQDTSKGSSFSFNQLSAAYRRLEGKKRSALACSSPRWSLVGLQLSGMAHLGQICRKWLVSGSSGRPHQHPSSAQTSNDLLLKSSFPTASVLLVMFGFHTGLRTVKACSEMMRMVFLFLPSFFYMSVVS